MQTGFLVCKTRVSNAAAEFCLEKWSCSLIAGLFAPPCHQSKGIPMKKSAFRLISQLRARYLQSLMFSFFFLFFEYASFKTQKLFASRISGDNAVTTSRIPKISSPSIPFLSLFCGGSGKRLQVKAWWDLRLAIPPLLGKEILESWLPPPFPQCSTKELPCSAFEDSLNDWVHIT